MVFELITVLSLGGYAYYSHLKRQQLQKELHDERLLEYAWEMFKRRTLGPSRISRINAIIRKTDIRTTHADDSELRAILIQAPNESEDCPQYSHTLNPESGYHVVRESSNYGPPNNRVILYRKPGERALLGLCFFKGELTWYFTTLDLPYDIVEKHNVFIETLLDSWLGYCNDKMFMVAVTDYNREVTERVKERINRAGE